MYKNDGRLTERGDYSKRDLFLTICSPEDKAFHRVAYNIPALLDYGASNLPPNWVVPNYSSDGIMTSRWACESPCRLVKFHGFLTGAIGEKWDTSVKSLVARDVLIRANLIRKCNRSVIFGVQLSSLWILLLPWSTIKIYVRFFYYAHVFFFWNLTDTYCLYGSALSPKHFRQLADLRLGRGAYK